MPCEVLAVYLPILLAPSGLFAEELKIAFRLLHSGSRMEVILKVQPESHSTAFRKCRCTLETAV